MSYCVLGVLIEAVTGKTYERVVYERLLTPLGISGMRMSSTYDLGPDEVSHHPSPVGTSWRRSARPAPGTRRPADLVTILNSIDHATPGWKALSPEIAEAMRYRIPAALPPSGYGLGRHQLRRRASGTPARSRTPTRWCCVQPDGVTWAVTVSGEYPERHTAAPQHHAQRARRRLRQPSERGTVATVEPSAAVERSAGRME